MIKKELQQDLNRTKLVLDYARQEIKEKDKEIERLNNIIKEVREYIENKVMSSNEIIDGLKKIEVEELLEILDKGE